MPDPTDHAPDGAPIGGPLNGPLIYAGIDEAGYGPLLGPLCVAASVFVVEGHDASAGPPNLWKRLSKVVCRGPSDRRRRIAVEDSKKLKCPNDGKAHPLRHLERGVLAFLAASRCGQDWTLPAADGDLLRTFGIDLPNALAAPWYDADTPIPVAHALEQIEVAAAMLRRGGSTAGVRCAALSCELLDAPQFNKRLAQYGGKAAVSFDCVVRLIDRIWRQWPEAHPRVVIDRQGGRMLYREPLQMCFPDAEITILGETERVSRYRLERDGAAVTLSFEVESEHAHLPTALASMTAKYVRELAMLRLNRWFCQQAPCVKATAGYLQDGWRWLGEMAPVLSRLSIDREMLVRKA